MKNRPLLEGLAPPPLPMLEPKAATSGSRSTIAPSACCRRIISCGETSCAASDRPMIRPVSWIGKKPLGISTNITKVSAMVAMNTASVIRWWRSTTSSVRR